MYGDARDFVKRSQYWGLLRLKNAVIFNQKIRPGRQPFDMLHADGFLTEDGFVTPRGQTVATTMNAHPDWRPGAKAVAA